MGAARLVEWKLHLLGEGLDGVRHQFEGSDSVESGLMQSDHWQA